MNRNIKSRGFTLIELLIVVVIIGILAAISYPSYRNYVIKTKRADAQAALMSAANAMERYKASNNFSYGGARISGAGANLAVFSDRVPVDGGETYYTLSIDPDDPVLAGATTFTLTATPVGGQVGDGALTIDQTGAKTWIDPVIGVKSCWSPKGEGCP